MAEIGIDKHRIESWQKVTGEAKYTDDLPSAGLLHARLTVSPYAHARIIKIDINEALSIPGVKLVLTGENSPSLCGPVIHDRPPIAKDIVRYAGEPVALAVAQDEAAASLAAEKVRVTYEELPYVLDPLTSFTTNTPILHEGLMDYVRMVDDVYPEPHSNISSYYPIRKGDASSALANCENTVTREYNLPPSAHTAMERRTARAQINHDGTVDIETASQAPYEVVRQLAACFGLQAGNIRVRVPFVGGGFGGKAPVVLEFLAYIASARLGGKAVRVVITRKEDMIFTPSRVGLYAKVKLGADKNGKLRAAELLYVLDGGAYADISPYMAKAISADCTGPYNIENVHCDAYSVYTNHTFATSFRGFAHEGYTFCIERALDELAHKMNIDPLELRRINAIRPGDLSPTQVEATKSNVGDLESCIDKLKGLGEWGSEPEQTGEYKVRAKGCACFWKAPTPPMNASSGAVIMANPDGSFNLSTGVVEIGSGGQSLLAQMLADRLGISTDQIHVVLAADTRLNPGHYKTVASFTTYLAGNAVMRAADDVIKQIKSTASLVLNCAADKLEVGGGKVYMRHEPFSSILLKDIVNGYTSPNTGTVGEPVIGSAGFMLKGITKLDKHTGKGKSAPSWTVGAQIVEIELDIRDCSYRIINAYTVMDVGKALNPASQRSMIMGGMSMGLSLASREVFHYDNGALTTPSLRTYKLIHFSERPKYHVEFVETHQNDAPYGSRAISEHGIIGMPAALANALSRACNVQADTLPLTPETLWRLKNRGQV